MSPDDKFRDYVAEEEARAYSALGQSFDSTPLFGEAEFEDVEGMTFGIRFVLVALCCW